MIPSDQSALLYCTDYTAQRSFISVVASGISNFVIRSDEWGIFYCTVHTAQTLLLLLWRPEFRISLFVPKNRDYYTVKNTQLKQALFLLWHPKFDFSWFGPNNRDYCTVQIKRIKQTSFLLYHPEIQAFVFRSDESGKLYCTDHMAQTSFFSVFAQLISTFGDSFRRIRIIVQY
jgi:hypothetical protein